MLGWWVVAAILGGGMQRAPPGGAGGLAPRFHAPDPAADDEGVVAAGRIGHAACPAGRHAGLVVRGERHRCTAGPSSARAAENPWTCFVNGSEQTEQIAARRRRWGSMPRSRIVACAAATIAEDRFEQ